ncbi:glycosyltransferase family 69 protein [Serpula lacrymans var. lacrymans S7.3]|uniref:Glycosyltransferase family 69 protein n=2 Tax=Serpula lacrymans var. lacrymans TaxID=341189 RepID=F8PSE0_SERL3|nr:glycosyltransferase family 69 protein [Serpula lacrymans var. lacrymans S7.9]EGO01270.1 glycosyltransferase family 69 protein [Serpula lacrymans var. lacrymans S7.3]EGO26910.1 glycosyltransferase family 69 protein [Serpula lacrymans var. lacrymans S7.9]
MQFRRVPTPLALILGILLGLLIGREFPTGVLSSAWRGVNGPIFVSRLSARKPVTLPSIDQRLRVLELLSTLSPHHTKECTRDSQPVYIQQVRDRYMSLVGHNKPSQSSWLTNWGLDLGSEEHHQVTPTKEHKYFFAINLYNSFDIIPDLFATLFRVSAILGYHNVYVSIYENGSTDQTKALLRIFDALTRSVGLRVTIRTSTRTRGAFNHRIEYLAEVRNQAFNPLHELRDATNEYFDTIIFMNDILPCVDDLLELIWQSRTNNAGITCAADYMYHDEIASPVFYDNWVARDINGTALENAPFENIFHDPASSERFQQHLPVQVQSCWNGIAVLDPAPFYTPPYVRFRMAKLMEEECSASECSLICNDYWEAGYGRILMVPRVKLAYDKKVFDIIHPSRRNLTAIRGYVRLGGLPDNPRTDPQDRSWFGPHDRLFAEEEGEALDFVPGPEYVWCWGWDGAGDIDGPDVDPIWERMPNRSIGMEAVRIKHDRSILWG